MDADTDSDYESYTESTDTEESDYSGHAQRILSSIDDSIEKIDDFLSFQRGFMHGDIVCAICDPSKQLGRVVDVDMSVDLEASSGELIEGVNSRKLIKTCPFSPGDYVIHGHWLGRLSRVVERITVLLNDGSRCEIMSGNSDNLIPLPPILFDAGSHPLYYPGQRVSVKHHSISENGRWLCGSWKAGQSEGIICSAEVVLVHVNWVTSLMCLCCNLSPPDHLQDPRMLSLLSCFLYANWQIGDCCTLSSGYGKYSKMADKEPASLADALKQSGSSGQLCNEIYSIVNTRIRVDVLWQNGRVSTGLDPETLLPVSNIGDHDFWPGQFVKEKVADEDVDFLSSSRHLGVVKNVDPQEQIVKVKWMTDELKDTVDLDRDMDEIVSAYELVEHPDASYSLGDIVIRFPNCENNDRNIFGVDNCLNDCKNKACSPGFDDCSSSCGSRIGFVIGFKDESIEVRWAGGIISKVHPYEIFGLDRLDELNSSSAVHQLEKNVHDEMSEHVEWQKNEVKKVENYTNRGSSRSLWDAGFFLLPLEAFRFLANYTKRLFSASGYSTPSSQNLSNFNYVDDKEINMPSLEGDVLQSGPSKEEANCGEEQIGRPALLVDWGKPERFKQFDCVSDYFDHHFANGISKDVTVSQIKSAWVKRVHQEWSILKKNLPESINVRVYEERVDLMRASIAGQPGTPYYNGLFFFDILLPENYPHEPPLVHYHSGGLRLNPNLYESGKICLSLLNTWTGNGTEVWNPNSSTILQVLLSLQFLVLNDKPYFNEAGYDKQMGRAESERNSINYNENAFLLTCKSMIRILRHPPKHFEAYVDAHFAECAHDILLACKAYMDGARIGSYASGMGSNSSCGKSSAGFRIMLTKIVPILVSCFTTKGIDCDHFINQGN